MNTKMFYLTVTLGASLVILVGCDDSDAKTRQRVQCSNNLKQVGVALVLYAQDHDNLFPKDLLAIAFSNYLDQPASLLVCPSDKAGMVSKTSSWNAFSG